MALNRQTKIKLTNERVEQPTGSTLNLSGTTIFDSGSTLTVLPNRLSGRILTSDDDGVMTLQRNIIYDVFEDSQDPTGFIDNQNIVVSYDAAARTITLSALTGTIQYYFHGTKYDLGQTWTSSAHTDTTAIWFLYSPDGVNFIWSNSVWDFNEVMVAARPANTNWAIRETHGIMQFTVHRELHETIGTYRVDGFGLTSGTFTLQPASPVDTDNTPGFEAGIIADEDNRTSLLAWLENSYTRLSFTGAEGVVNFETGQTSIFRVGIKFPLINTWNGTTFNDVEAANSRYLNYYVIRIPVASDSISQQYRAVILQPQNSYTSLAAAEAENPLALNLGGFTFLSPEYTLVERITLGTSNSYNGALGYVRIEAWTILTGSRVNLTSTTPGAGTITAGNVSVVPTTPFVSTDLQSLSNEYANRFAISVTGGTNGLSKDGALDLKLGGTLTEPTTISGAQNLNIDVTNLNLTGNTAINLTGTVTLQTTPASGNTGDDILLWDDATKQIRSIPFSEFDIPSGERVSKIITQSSHGFAAQDVIGISGGTYNKAIADGSYSGEIIGIVTEVIDTNSFELTQSGYFTGFTGLVAGTTYFLSTAVAGDLTTLEPTIEGELSKAVLIADTTTSAWVLPYPAYIISTGTTDPLTGVQNIGEGVGIYDSTESGSVRLRSLLGSGDTTVFSSGDTIIIHDPLSLHLDQTVQQTVTGGPKMDFINFNVDYVDGVSEGRLQWNSEDGTLEFGMPGGVVNLQIGQEQLVRVRNDSGALIENGKVVRLTGGTGGFSRIGLADNTDIVCMAAVGLTTEDIADGSFGYVNTRGMVRNVDTSGFGIGDLLWLSSAGTYTNIMPEAPLHHFIVGVVIKVDALEGIIYVSMQGIPPLSKLSDTFGTPTTTGQFYAWNQDNSRFQLDENILNYITGASTGLNVVDREVKLGGGFDESIVISGSSGNSFTLCVDNGIYGLSGTDSLFAMLTNYNGNGLFGFRLPVTSSGATSQDNLGIGVNTGNAQFGEGLYYEIDYSNNFVARSIPDVAYVTGLTSNIPITGASTGLNVVDRVVKLGGSFTEDIIISGDSQFGITSDQLTYLISKVGLILRAGTTEFGDVGFRYPVGGSGWANVGIEVDSGSGGTGLFYIEDYSANYHNRSIPDVAFVTGLTAPISGSSITGATNIGGGEGIYSSTSNKSLQLRTLVGSGDTTVTTVGDEIIVNTNIPATTYGTLNTTCTTALSTNASESFGDAICLHRVAKTGCYTHLSGTPTIPTVNDGQLSISGGTVISGGGIFTANQAGSTSVTLNHDNVSCTPTTTAQTATFGGTFTAIDTITSTAQGHITGVRTKTVTLPTPTAPSNATICISGGTGLTTGGDFTLNQSAGETITLNHATYTARNVSATNADIISCVVSDGIGHVTNVLCRTLTPANIGAEPSFSKGDLVASPDIFLTGATTGRLYGVGNVGICHCTSGWAAKTSLTNAAVISNLTVNTQGHISDWTTRNLTASDIDAASTTHVHGEITSGGTVTTNVVIENTDRLLITDASDSFKVKGGVGFGTSTVCFLANNGTWVTPPNTTYSLISEAEIINSASTTARLVSGGRLNYWANQCGWISGATNIGGGEEIFSSKSGRDIQLRTLVGSGDTTVTTVGDEIRIFSEIPESIAGDAIKKEITQASHGFSVGDVVGFSGTTYNKPIASTSYDGEVLGVVNKVVNTDTFEFTQAGFITGLTSLVQGNTYYLSPTTAGLLTSTRPDAEGQIVNTMLFAATTTTGWVLPYPGFVVSTGDTGSGVQQIQNIGDGIGVYDSIDIDVAKLRSIIGSGDTTVSLSGETIIVNTDAVVSFTGLTDTPSNYVNTNYLRSTTNSIEYRTPAQVLSDIGAQPAGTYDNYVSWNLCAVGVTGTHAITSGGIFCLCSGTDLTIARTNGLITLNHAGVSRTNNTSTQTATNGGTFTTIDSITSSTQGHITAINTKTVTLPSYTIPTVNNTTITISAGTDLTTGGSFTTNQSTTSTITLNHATSGWVNKTTLANAAVISNLTVNAQGHISNWTTRNLTASDIGAQPAGSYEPSFSKGNITQGTGISLIGTLTNRLVNAGDVDIALDTTYADGRYLLKTNNLSDLTNTTTARTNLGLGSMATQNTSSYLTAAETLANKGALGSIDLNTLSGRTDMGTYYQNANANATLARNYPTALAGSLLVQEAAGVTQLYITYGASTQTVFFRGFYSGSWMAWKEIYHSGNLRSDTDNDARYLLEINNLSDLTNTATARTNLGLGTMATESASNYDNYQQFFVSDGGAVQQIAVGSGEYILFEGGDGIDTTPVITDVGGAASVVFKVDTTVFRTSGNQTASGCKNFSTCVVTPKVITNTLQVITGAASGCVLTSDASGNATWQTPPGGVSGSGTAGRAARWATTSSLGNSAICDNGSSCIAVNSDVVLNTSIFATQGAGGPTIYGCQTFQSTDGLAAVAGETTSAGIGYLGTYRGNIRAGVYGIIGTNAATATLYSGYFDGRVGICGNLEFSCNGNSNVTFDCDNTSLTSGRNLYICGQNTIRTVGGNGGNVEIYGGCKGNSGSVNCGGHVCVVAGVGCTTLSSYACGGELHLAGGIATNTSTGGRHGGDTYLCGGNANCTVSTGYIGGDVWICSGLGGSKGEILMRVGGSTIVKGCRTGCIILYDSGADKLHTQSYGVCVNGVGCATDWISSSDKRLKTNIQPISNALSVVSQLCGVCYEMCDDENHENRVGLIAQDVETILPEVVSKGDVSEQDMKYGVDDFRYGIKYDKITSVLVEAIKEQQKQIDELKNQINMLKTNKND